VHPSMTLGLLGGQVITPSASRLDRPVNSLRTEPGSILDAYHSTSHELPRQPDVRWRWARPRKAERGTPRPKPSLDLIRLSPPVSTRRASARERKGRAIFVPCRFLRSASQCLDAKSTQVGATMTLARVVVSSTGWRDRSCLGRLGSFLSPGVTMVRPLVELVRLLRLK
jgi:hypothetical protein